MHTISLPGLPPGMALTPAEFFALVAALAPVEAPAPTPAFGLPKRTAPSLPRKSKPVMGFARAH